jgi:hypothetical protein
VKDSERGTINLRMRPETREAVAASGIRLLSRLDLQPGRYVLRIAAMNALGASRGSVQYDLDVPDFSKGAVAMSGIALASTVPTLVTGDAAFWKERFTSPPTASREFSPGDRLTFLAEIYANNQKAGQRIDVITSAEAEDGSVVYTHREELPADLTRGRSATFRHSGTIPLAAFAPGHYVLTVRAESTAAPGKPVIRQVLVAVR